MKVKVIETGRIDILDLRNASGQDNLPDIIGNQDCFGDDTSYQFQREWDEEEGDEVYLTSQACYEWWVDMISLLEEEQDLIDELSEEHGSEAVYEAISDIDGDLKDATEARIATLKEAFGE
jgi:hypothetical protein